MVVATLSPVQPSWSLNAGVPNSCSETSGSDLNTTVAINNPSAASEQGVLSVQGVGAVGNTNDSSFTGVNANNSFTIFVTSTYNVPAHTPINLTITTFNMPNFLGGVSFVDSHTWDCTTGQFLATFAAPIPTVSAAGMLVLAGLLIATVFILRRRAN